MLNIPELPHEIIVEIFFMLTPLETQSLISKLHQILDNLPPNLDTAANNVKLLIRFAFQRLYSGKLLVTSDYCCKKGLEAESDVVLSLRNFEDKFLESKENEIENTLFKKTRPQILKFRFIRDVNDYSNFVDDLYSLNAIFDNLNDRNEITKYFGIACQLELYIDGYTIGVESPTAILIAVLKTLINLANPDTALKNSLSSKFKSITIKSTDIGDYYVSRWSQLLGCFTNVTYLNLSDNIIKLDCNPRNEGELDIKIDLLANDFVWPPALKELNLDNNLLTYISKRFVLKLPSNTLEKLLICSNKLTTLGQTDFESFNFTEVLPQLTSLKLNFNNTLMLVNERMFDKISLTGKFRSLELGGCNIDEHNMLLLKAVSKRENFSLLS